MFMKYNDQDIMCTLCRYTFDTHTSVDMWHEYVSLYVNEYGHLLVDDMKKRKRKVCYFICFLYFKAFFPLRLSVQIFNIMHYLIVPRVLSISSIYSVNSFILINCAVQA